MQTILGLTWDHPRATEGLFKVTEDFLRHRPNVRIRWETHPLRGFESTPIEALADRYDLIILDHPFMGDVAASGCLIDLNMYHDPLDLARVGVETVGRSYETYSYAGQWAVPIDAACQVAVFRPDLLTGLAISPPRTWSELEALARLTTVGVALGTVHSLMTFFTLCSNLGSQPTALPDQPLVDFDIGLRALARLRQLRDWHPRSITWNAIDVQEVMATSDTLAYCPYVYGYVSYARPGRYRHSLAYAGIPSGDESGSVAGSTIGGTGLAISRRCTERSLALSFAAYLTRGDIQIVTGLNGGQPAHRTAWLDPALNAGSGDFYRDTLATLEAATIRPRYPGYMTLQNEGGEVLGRHLRGAVSAEDALTQLNAIHHQLLNR
jgi:multiple sugar transport system substrate-binding protein